MNKPARLLDGAPYVNAANTDIRKTFAKVRKEMEAQKKKATVTPIKGNLARSKS